MAKFDRSLNLANFSLAEMADARTDAIIRAKIKAMRQARRNARQAPKLGDILTGRVSKGEYYAHITGR